MIQLTMSILDNDEKRKHEMAEGTLLDQAMMTPL